MSFLISDAVAQTAATPAAQQQSPYSMLLIMGGMFIFMYFLIIRPQRKRQKEQQALMNSLSKGDEVVLTSGLLGKIVRIEGDYLVLNTGDNIELKFQRQAVHAVLPKGTIKAI
ncbi:MAG: preprotein translocase subunit YajC [Pseudomonadales bacterium]|nr:preprotein translocase subunit YajC [Pseudomonadales bacterium]